MEGALPGREEMGKILPSRAIGDHTKDKETFSVVTWKCGGWTGKAVSSTNAHTPSDTRSSNICQPKS